MLGRSGGARLARTVFGQPLLTELGQPRRLRSIPSSPRSRVWRARLAGSPVIVKHVVDGPDADSRFSREVTALRLAARVDPPVVPTLLGADPVTRVLVLQRLTGRQLGTRRQLGTGWQLDYAASLARLHAAGRAAEPGTLPAWQGPGTADVDAFLALADQLGVPAPATLGADLTELVCAMPSAGQALLHGDPCPDNLVATTGGIRFLDLEQAALGNGLIELAYLGMGFPTCWCVTSASEPVLRAAEQAYRDAWLAETGEPVTGDLTEACVGWLLRSDALVQRAERGVADQFPRLLQSDWRWGTVTARERLAYRLSVVTGLLTADRRYPHLRTLTGAMREAMLERWPSLRPPPGG